MPLTQEQFQKARQSGFTTNQIIDFEKRRTLEQPIPTSNQIPTTQEQPKNFLQRYLTEAQPAFKVAISHPETMFGKPAIGSNGKPLTPQELTQAEQQDWSDIYRQAALKMPFARSTSTAGQLVPQAVGMGLDLGTRPSSYVGSYAIPKVIRKMAITPMTRRFMQTQTPTLSKPILEANPVEPVYKVINDIKVDIMKPLPKKSEWLVQQGNKLVNSVEDTITNTRLKYSNLLKSPNQFGISNYEVKIPERQISILPKGLMGELGLTKESATVGNLWEKRWDLLKQLNESAFTKEELLKRTKLSEDAIMNALTRMKALVLNNVDDTTRNAIMDLDPQFTDIMQSGKGLLRSLYNPETGKINTNTLVSTFRNPDSAGSRDLFRRFSYWDGRINEVEKSMKSYVFKQMIKKYTAAVGGAGAGIYAAHRYITDKLLNKR